MEPYVLAVTGGIGSGKSVVTRRFADLGSSTIDMDKVIHQLYRTNKPLIEEIINEFGESVRASEGIDRKALSKLVFSAYPEAQQRKKKLESIVLPVASKEFYDWKYCQNGFCVAEVSVLYEIGWEDKVERIALVISPDNLRADRIMKRDNIAREQALLRIASQIPQEEKIARAIKSGNYVIDNSGTLENTYLQVQNILEEQRHCGRVNQFGST